MSVALAAPGLARQFAVILGGLCDAVAARMAKPLPELPLYRRPGRRATFPLLMLLYTRLRRMVLRFNALAARAEAGTLAPPAIRPARPPRPRRPDDSLPRGIGWLLPLLPAVAAGHGSQLHHLLSSPDMAAFLDTAPQAGRILRPLCRMLAIPAPVPPLRPARPAAAPPPSPPDHFAAAAPASRPPGPPHSPA